MKELFIFLDKIKIIMRMPLGILVLSMSYFGFESNDKVKIIIFSMLVTFVLFKLVEKSIKLFRKRWVVKLDNSGITVNKRNQYFYSWAEMYQISIDFARMGRLSYRRNLRFMYKKEEIVIRIDELKIEPIGLENAIRIFHPKGDKLLIDRIVN